MKKLIASLLLLVGAYMPHDAAGNLLNVGDIVHVPCKIKEIQLGEEYCNLTLETNFQMWPSENRSTLSLNGKQVYLKK